MLDEAQKRALLAIARDAIRSHLAGEPSVYGMPDGLPPATGVFVTLKRGAELRGCLGTLQMYGGLPSEVARCAVDSATRDPRFVPLTADELRAIRIEISVLGPLESIDPSEPSAIEVGAHGLVVEQGSRRGLLLPQVPLEWGWSREQFLCHTCQKAGLPADAWRNGAQVYRFTAQVFGEATRS